MPAQTEFQVTFEKLRDILRKYERPLLVQTDKRDNYYLNTPFSGRYKKALFFGAAQIKKSYVTYYPMPAYMFPELLERIPAEPSVACRGSRASTPRLFGPVTSGN